MEFVASYLLCVENKQEPTKANMSKLLKAVSASFEETELDSFIAKIGGRSHEEVLSAGSAMMTLRSASAGSATAGQASAKVEAAESESSESSEANMDFF